MRPAVCQTGKEAATRSKFDRPETRRSTSAVRLTLRTARLEPMSGHTASFIDYGAEILKILGYE
jgi:hypothetical protein